MKITVEINPEDLAVITEQVMKAAGPEAMTRLIAIGNQIAGQMQAHMLSQIRGFPAIFHMQLHSTSEKSRRGLLRGPAGTRSTCLPRAG